MTHFKKCTLDDIGTLREISYNTYNDTFARLNTPSNMLAYLNQAFSLEKMKSELSNRHSLFYFLYHHDMLAGFL